MLYSSVEEMIGNTPLLRAKRLEQKLDLQARLLLKAERFNPAGSAKDRAAVSLLDGFEQRGLLKAGGTVIEPTSGNTGIALAMVGSVRGYRVVIVMPDSMSVERIRLMKAYGAEVVLTKGSEGISGAVRKAEELQKELPGSVIAGQFTNPDNRLAHYRTTGPELWRDTEGKLDVFVAGIGTGGTLSGTGRYLKEMNAGIRVIGVEPAASPLLTKGISGPHPLQGIGADFVPEVLDRTVVDSIVCVEGEDAFAMARLLARTEGLLCGITSGAALYAAVQEAMKKENAGKTVAALLPDTGERYLSGALFGTDN